MAHLPVTHSRKDQYGNITALGCPGQTWSPRSSSLIIDDITGGSHTYYVPWTTGRTAVQVIQGQYGPYLRTDSDSTTRNNLDDLPGI